MSSVVAWENSFVALGRGEGWWLSWWGWGGGQHRWPFCGQVSLIPAFLPIPGIHVCPHWASMMGGSLFLLIILAPPSLLQVSWFCCQHYRTCSVVFISSPKVLSTSVTLSCLYLVTVISVGFVEGEGWTPLFHTPSETIHYNDLKSCRFMLVIPSCWMFNFFFFSDFSPLRPRGALHEAFKPFVVTSLGLMVRSGIRLNVVGKGRVDILTVPLTC